MGLQAGQTGSDDIFRSDPGTNLTDRFCVLQSGCIGLCKYEPVVQIEEPGKPTVTYIRMTPDKAKEVLERHLLGGQIIDQYTLDYADHQ